MKWTLIVLAAFLLGFGLGGFWLNPGIPVKKQIPETPSPQILYHCPMHPEIIKDGPGKCPKCAMDLVQVKTNESSAVQINPVVLQNIGVKTEKVRKKQLTREIRTTGIIRADETRQYIVTSRADCWIEKLNVNYTEYLLAVRIRKAEKLLAEKDYRVYEVAEMVGFSNSQYFNQCFKKSTGLTPGEFRKNTLSF